MTIHQIDRLIELGVSLKFISQAYCEIANIKLRKIRDAVLRNRLFFDEISQIYGIVKGFAIKKGVLIPRPKRGMHILLTPNYKFYGNINLSLINYFLGSTKELKDVDKIILGKGGIDYFRANKMLLSYKEVVLKDDMPSAQELANLANIISEYDQVLVFFAKFKSLLVQKPTFTDITATSFYARVFQVGAFIKPPMQFIFEPELPKILRFFENQILTLLLEQTFLESELSRTASRFISMDQAQTEADKFIKEYRKVRSHIQKNFEDIKILENFATLMAAKKGTIHG